MASLSVLFGGWRRRVLCCGFLPLLAGFRVFVWCWVGGPLVLVVVVRLVRPAWWGRVWASLFPPPLVWRSRLVVGASGVVRVWSRVRRV